MKWFHNGPVGRGIAVILEVLIHLVFAFGMFYLGQFLGSLILGDIPNGPYILGISLATVMFLGAMYAFVYHEYTRKDVRAYERKEGDGSFEKATDELQKIVAGMEIASLLYRCVNTLPNWIGALITFALGLLLLRFAFNLGKVIHAVTNRPVSEEFKRVRDELDRDLIKSGLDYREQMDYDQKRRFRNGDVSVIDEIRRGQDRRRELDERDRMDTELAEGAVERMLGMPDDEDFPPALPRRAAQ